MENGCPLSHPFTGIAQLLSTKIVSSLEHVLAVLWSFSSADRPNRDPVDLTSHGFELPKPSRQGSTVTFKMGMHTGPVVAGRETLALETYPRGWAREPAVGLCLERTVKMPMDSSDTD